MLAALLTLALTAGSASAEPAVADVCQVTDQRLEELSGLASDGDEWFAINDSDTGRIQLQVMDRTCEITRTITAATNPFDVEDLALAPDGTLWLADTGDNGRSRETVALHAISPDGTARLYRLTYPDGKHDAEALLLDAGGVPHIVTKESLGSPLVYRPTGDLDENAPTPMRQVAKVSISGSDTPGGPLQSSVVTRVVTGGAMSKDGRVAALRTYTDAYLFPVPDGDLAKALESDPVRIPLPNEPQGEAITFDPDGTLLSASEFGDQRAASTVRAVAGAAALAAPITTTATPPPPQGDTAAAPAPQSDDSRPLWPIIGAGAAVLALMALFVRRSRNRKP
ncbi:hypothetical protein FHS29_006572 [Saccharothrix tamanrassetensis]|uniref:Esterase-like activity of phytase family protein n=1 Tax=Saccharothrix tamanrassetensis TaxID=1051531 RepID=A0A841CRS9_9PSEU|nr:hypothetical protein [Saccharothrix tamanrassetensis]MBB5959950.1 hypothetical protein [Saccharothrix tamanrassetensis]